MDERRNKSPLPASAPYGYPLMYYFNGNHESHLPMLPNQHPNTGLGQYAQNDQLNQPMLHSGQAQYAQNDQESHQIAQSDHSQNRNGHSKPKKQKLLGVLKLSLIVLGISLGLGFGIFLVIQTLKGVNYCAPCGLGKDINKPQMCCYSSRGEADRQQQKVIFLLILIYINLLITYGKFFVYS